MKTNLLTVTLLLVTSAIIAQNTRDKVFHLDSLHNITTEQNFRYTRVVEDYDSKKNTYAVSEYYKSGKISMSATTKDKNSLKLEGTRIDYYENGNKKRESKFSENKPTGKQIQWYENGNKKIEREINWDTNNKKGDSKILQFWNPEGTQTVTEGNGQMEETDGEFNEKGEIKNGEKEGIWEGKSIKRNYTFTEKYKNGKFISGISTDTNNNKYPYKETMEKPTPIKGISDFYQHVARNFKAPKEPRVNGKVFVKFVIDKEGNITDIKILKDLPGYNSKEEVINTLLSYGKWNPGKMRGVPTRVMYSLPITISNSPNQNR